MNPSPGIKYSNGLGAGTAEFFNFVKNIKP